jgi:uncharacterized protein YbjQ (UPF0145 family)
MKNCPKCGELLGDNVSVCFNCKFDFNGSESKKYDIKKIILSTTNEIIGYNIERYIDVVGSDVAIGTGFLSELGAAFADFGGTTARGYSEKLNQAKTYAFETLKERAKRLGANAVIGIKFSISSTLNNIFIVSYVGTAVLVSKKQ